MLSKRATSVRPFQVMNIVEQARQLEAAGHSVIQLGVGEQAIETPAAIAAAGVEAIHTGQTRYTPALGTVALREAVANYYQTNQFMVSRDQVAITAGASAALQLAMAAVTDVNEAVMVISPGYPCNVEIARMLGNQIVVCDTDETTGFVPSLQAIQNSWRANVRALLLASPANPTGAVLSLSELQAIADWVVAQDAWLIVDEIYHCQLFPSESNQSNPSRQTVGVDPCSRPSTALALSATVRERLIVINSFSKTFAMTGWRLGWCVASAEVISAMQRLAQNLFLAPSTIAQAAAMQAFNDESLQLVDKQRLRLAANVSWLVDALRECGFIVPCAPQGAFYVFADASHLTKNATHLCAELLEATHVAICPGVDFVLHEEPQFSRYKNWVRIAATVEIDLLITAIDRIKQHLAKHS